MSQKPDGYQLVNFPKIRRLMVDGGQLAREKHLVHGLVEMDITQTRQIIHDFRKRTGKSLSFTAFFISCLGKAVNANNDLQTYRTWGSKLVVYDDVDINTMFEVEENGQKIIRPHIIRAANRKTPQEIDEEIKEFQAKHAESREGNFIDWFVLLPGFVRRLFLRYILKNPRLLKEMNGTVSFSALSMFGTGVGWAIPATNHTLQITLGGIAKRPGVVRGQVENREYLCVTISIDHDLVDGAPAARFIHQVKRLVEAGEGLSEVER